MVKALHVGGTALTDMLGIRTDRATATLPASGYGALFTITGGRVLMNMLLGEVTTIIQAQACTVKVTGTPTTGTAVDLSAASASVSAKEVGSLWGFVGPSGTALNVANAGGVPWADNSIVVPIGTVGITTSATNTGSVKWAIWWVPLDSGAQLVAA
jgi:hypothetical protein